MIYWNLNLELVEGRGLGFKEAIAGMRTLESYFHPARGIDKLAAEGRSSFRRDGETTVEAILSAKPNI